MKHAERAKTLFQSGYNCAQAVAGAFAEDFGVDIDTVMRMTAALGGGFARQREICGAVLGMGIVLGMAEDAFDPKDANTKTAVYRRTQALCAKFAEENGSIICRELLGGAKSGGDPAPRTDAYYKKRPCAELVAFAAGLLEDELRQA